MFIYISRYKDLFFFGLQCFGRFPIIQSSSSCGRPCPFTIIYSSIFPMLFFGSQTLQLLLFPCHEPTTIQCSIVLSHCGFMFLFKLFLFKLSRHILRDSGLKRFFNIYIKHDWGFYKQAFVMVNSVIIRKFFTTTIIMPAFLKFLFWMSSDWLHFSDSKFHYGSLSATQ